MASTLKEHSVTLLVDVRDAARSRIPGFSKSALRLTMMGEGIEYQHEPSLGNKNRKMPDTPVLLADELTGLAMLASILTLQSAVIMCACRMPEGCHRSYIADRLRGLSPSLEVKHIA